MKVNEDGSMMIEINNNKTRYTFIIQLLSVIVIISIWMYLATKSIMGTVIIFGVFFTLTLLFFVAYCALTASDKPDVYRITDDELWYRENYEEGNEFRKYKFSSINKLVFKNRRVKWLKLWLKNYGDRPYKLLTAPTLENCNEEWQQLFEEIRKRIPPDAEVIVK